MQVDLGGQSKGRCGGSGPEGLWETAVWTFLGVAAPS